MSVSPHLNAQQFWHGSPHVIPTGEMVEPGHPQEHPRTKGEVRADPTNYVYAAQDKSRAGYFGNHIYRVQPTGEMQHDPEDVWDMGLHRSASPMKVIGEYIGSVRKGSYVRRFA